jgi:hypothetical protein
MQHPDKHTCNIRVQSLQHMQHSDLLLQHPHETLETYLRNIWNTWNMRLQHGRTRGRAIPAIGVGDGVARAPPPSPSLAAPGLARPGESERRGMGERDGRERAARDGWAQRVWASSAGWARRSSETEWTCGVQTGRPWLVGHHIGEGQRRAGGAVAAPVAVACVQQWGKQMSMCFFYFLEKPRYTEGGAEEAYWAGSLGRPRNEQSGRNTPGRTPMCHHYIVIQCVQSHVLEIFLSGYLEYGSSAKKNMNLGYA